jgi:hypothetical protein
MARFELMQRDSVNGDVKTYDNISANNITIQRIGNDCTYKFKARMYKKAEIGKCIVTEFSDEVSVPIAAYPDKIE